MIKLENVRKHYGTGESKNEVLKGVSLAIADGDFTVILGTSGSGKSTLLNIASGLEPADSGHIRYGKADLTSMTDKELTNFRKENVGYIFQQYFLLPNLTVDKNVKMGADLAGNRQYQKIIDAVGLGSKLHKYPHELSGGEQQRVAVARALAKNPKILYLDEPTGALDEETGRLVLDYIANLKNTLGFTMVMVTHNQNIADMANTVIRMNSGRIVDEYHNENQKTAYEIAW